MRIIKSRLWLQHDLCTMGGGRGRGRGLLEGEGGQITCMVAHDCRLQDTQRCTTARNNLPARPLVPGAHLCKLVAPVNLGGQVGAARHEGIAKLWVGGWVRASTLVPLLQAF